MRAIAAVIGWNASAFHAPTFWDQVARISPEIGLDRTWKVSAGGFCSAGCAGAERVPPPRAMGVAARDGILAVGDCRLLDREVLRREVGQARLLVSDIELVADAYSKWADDFPRHLAGDFAVVVHDGPRARVVLAVGASGARHLYYRRFSDGVMAASYPTLLQAIGPLRRTDVDARTVRDYLLGQHRDASGTFFTDVLRVPPGKQVTLGAQSTLSRRHFTPPENRDDTRTTEDCLHQFRELFETCVSDVIDPGAHHGVHLSGGLDSSSIAMTLPRIDTRGATFELLTATFPTIRTCDEAATVAAVAKCLPFRGRFWNAERAPRLEDEDRLWPWPMGVVATAIANYDDLDMAAAAGAVAVLSGDGGDGLAVETAVFRDLARHGQWRLLWNELAAPELLGYARRYILHQVARDILRRAVGRGLPRSGKPPAWFGPRLADLDAAASVSESKQDDRLPDLVQQQAWNAMTEPRGVWVLEGMSLRALRAGVELRCPYRDPRLTAFVAAIPFDRRICRGTLRRLQREGLADRLPLSVRQRVKVDFSPAVRALVQDEWRAMQTLIQGQDWCAEPYVPWAAFSDMVERAFGAERADFRDWNRVRRIWTLELWLRKQAV